MDADYDTDLESSVADVMQCAVDGKGDHILAARFLNRFVPKDIAWLHLDLSRPASRSGGLAHIGTDITGFGVRYTLELLRRGMAAAAREARDDDADPAPSRRLARAPARRRRHGGGGAASPPSASARAIVMPNLKPPITTTALAGAYRARILAALPAGSRFEPLMTLYLTDAHRAEEIDRARGLPDSCTA